MLTTGSNLSIGDIVWTTGGSESIRAVYYVPHGCERYMVQFAKPSDHDTVLLMSSVDGDTYAVVVPLLNERDPNVGGDVCPIY